MHTSPGAVASAETDLGPCRWTMVFPLGMYCVASWALGGSLHAAWLSELGRLWLVVAFSGWAAVAFGELGHLLVG